MASTPRKKTPARKAADPLQRYNAKRRFDITSEPSGKAVKGKPGFAYVIQQHDATRMHYDFRLELDGVLLSWAVPKGPSLSVKEKRLAVQTEDHPLDYRDFEGQIPHDEYGGGPVIVWDRGTWTPEDDPHRGMQKGHLTFALHGEKLQGRYQLVRLHSRGKEPESGPQSNWLLMKRSDEFVREDDEAEPTQRLTKSVISGRTVQEIGAERDAPAPPPTDTAATRAHAARKSTSKPVARMKSGKPAAAKATAGKRSAGLMKKTSLLLQELSPQLAQLVETAPTTGYRYEVKFDGYRLLAGMENGAAALRSRNNLDWTTTFPHITGALAGLDVAQAVVDGELCYVDENGRTDFQQLQNALGMGRSAQRGRSHARQGEPIDDRRLVFYVFDLLYENGRDLRTLPLADRKKRLFALLKKNKSKAIRYSEDLDGDPRAILAQACRLGLEGVIGKRPDAPYREGRGRDWIKLKCNKRQEFVIVGYSESDAREGFRSLMLGLRENGRLRYAGRVGTGFNTRSHGELSRRLAKLKVDVPAFDNPPRERDSIWVKPDLVCEVSYAEMTREGVLRHPSFEGLRLDKPAGDVVREQAVTNEPSAPKPVKRATKKTTRKADVAPVDDHVLGVHISHPERVMDEDSGLTKLQLARYHERVADLLIREAARRPLAVVRCPQGDAHQCFFQKHVTPGVGKDVKQINSGGSPGLVVTEAKGILELVQFNAMELHGWGSRMPKGDRPDWLIFDLDPDTALGFGDVVTAAFEMREALQSLGFTPFVKTTGGKGLHVVVPLLPKAGWVEAKEFCKQIAQTFARQHPDRYVANMAKAQRTGKIFIDYLRNGLGATAVLPYSPRARPGAPVALPVEWKQLEGLDPHEFRVDNVEQWMKGRRDPWAGLRDAAVVLPEIGKL